MKQNWIDMTAPEAGKVWYCRDIAGAARYWRHILETADREREHIPPSNYYTLKYEEVVSKPEETLRGLFEFLGEAWEPGVLTNNPIQTHALNRWRSELTPDQLHEFAAIAGDRMAAMGYAL